MATAKPGNNADPVRVGSRRTPGGVLLRLVATKQSTLVTESGHSPGLVAPMKPFVGKSKSVDGYGNQNLSPSGSSGWPVDGSGIDAHLFFFKPSLVLLTKNPLQFCLFLLVLLRVTVISVYCVGHSGWHNHCQRMPFEQFPIVSNSR